MSADLGKQALDAVIETLQIDPGRMQRIDNGFEWWPGRFKVSVRAQQASNDAAGSWVLRARTSFLKNVPVTDEEVRISIDSLAALAPSFAWVYLPPDAASKYGITEDHGLWFETDVYIREDNIGWLPRFFACLALMQPVYAEKDHDLVCDLLGAEPDFSYPAHAPNVVFHDDILNVPAQIYMPLGKKENRFADSEELEQIAERFGRNDLCFGMGDRNGLTLETPIGSQSALIRLFTEQTHPDLGCGLLSTLTMPNIQSRKEAIDQCMWNNFFQATMWTDVPLIGSWSSKKRQEGEYYSAYSSFFPSALYQPNITTNAALWMLGTARFIKSHFYPDLKDLTMGEIFENRYGNTSS